MSPSDLRATAYRGIKWSALAAYAGRFARLITLLILMALLDEGEFGVLAIASIVIVVSQVFCEAGVGQALIWHRGKHSDDPSVAMDTGFVIVSVMNLTVITLMVLAAPWVAAFFNEPRAIPVIRVLLLAMALSSLTIVPRSMLERDLRFKRAVLPEVIPAIASGFVSIPLAILWHSVWALVAGQLTSAVIRLVLYAWAAGWRPRGRYDRQVGRDLLLYAVPLLGVALIGVFVLIIPSGTIGHLLGTEALGVFEIANRIASFPFFAIIYVVGRVMFPLYTRLRDDRQQLGMAIAETMKLIALTAAPLCIGLAVVIPAAELVVFQGKWWALPIPLALMLIRALQRAAGSVTGDALKAIGRPGLLQLVFTIRVAVLLPACITGALMWGLNGAVLGTLVSSTIVLGVEASLINRHIGLAPGAILDAIKVPLIAACLSGIAANVFLWKGLLGPTALGLIVGIGAGAVVYALIILRWERPMLRDLARAFRPDTDTPLPSIIEEVV
ncbi:oligosaccharide flippase family protein [Candidatus Sumerlaeota bacterium]|nr:oligosaccharide flippase family protein [Candidatus Sumerlaeota bacterium]